MEDTFKVRVDRIFGSLDSSSAASPPPASSLRSLWCLTDDEVERKEWNRDKGSPTEFEPEQSNGELRIEEVPSRGLGELEEDLEDLGDDDLDAEEGEGEPSSQSGKPDDYNDEEWEIKSSIGRDCTLDYEEEEDVFDKVAVGREKAGDRLYMKDVTDYGIHIDSGNELPSSFGEVNRDPRANYIAAKLRLKEDAEAAGKLDSLSVVEGNANSAANSRVQPAEDDANLKPILKRKDGQTDSKTRKRVRFDPECIEKAPAEAEDIQMETEEAAVTTEVSVPTKEFSSAVPDYIRNPSRYTYYTFDSSSDMDEQSNRQAYMDFLNTVRKAEGSDDETPADLPKSVMFVPRKKRNEAAETENGADSLQDKEEVSREVPGGHRRAIPIGIAAVGDQESEVSAMDEDETESAVNVRSSSKRAGRQYRVKSTSEADE
ncbi:uncharacterized protein LOC116197174 [Punica granatum]|uniref:U5 small nuclear ribonucleoprotein TSSC4 n=2 Tax=Punica granatum TaxID=22663 RepID=A0A218WFY6_PUNGR|nr:uncharacterized protein LOC116197174 [Punica granatum]OWM71388.1 hypothetical protein CDL15_Pgr005575 [Punica granatum]PKI52496.1 hypothetical protein CRG98_027068 [Punica granatum]